MNDPIRGGLLLFPGFELLDAAGPLAVLGKLPGKLTMTTFAEESGPVQSAQGNTLVAEHALSDCPPLDLLVVPGGSGTRAEVENETLLRAIRQRSEEAAVVFSVCTGAALLARAGVLDGRRATSNKSAFEWVREQSSAVSWVERARWVEDGRFVTSSGVAAGIDAAFAVLSRLVGEESSARVADAIEYIRHVDPEHDPFALMPDSDESSAER
jgi:transcriptional regulator GlxA family with amidase domain